MARGVALIFGIIYTVVGIVGFIPSLGGTFGVAPSALLHTFNINVVHNIVHLVIGIGALAVSGRVERAASWLQAWGYILIIIAIIGFFWKNPLNIIPLGGPDVWLHLVTGIIFLWAAVTAPRPATAS
jgi:hypothetical protein